MSSYGLPPIMTLVLLLAVSAWAEDRPARDAANRSDELPWLTQQVDAPGVSFHTFRSHAAKADVSYHVYRPETYEEAGIERFPVLYWLHGTEGGVNHIRPVSQMFDLAIRDKGVPPMACFGKPDPVDMKVYCPCGEEAFDDEETTEEAQARRDCREAARRGRDAECWQGVGGGAADAGDQRGHAGSLAKTVRRDEVRGGQAAEAA